MIRTTSLRPRCAHLRQPATRAAARAHPPARWGNTYALPQTSFRLPRYRHCTTPAQPCAQRLTQAFTRPFTQLRWEKSPSNRVGARLSRQRGRCRVGAIRSRFHQGKPLLPRHFWRRYVGHHRSPHPTDLRRRPALYPVSPSPSPSRRHGQCRCRSLARAGDLSRSSSVKDQADGSSRSFPELSSPT